MVEKAPIVFSRSDWIYSVVSAWYLRQQFGIRRPRLEINICSGDVSLPKAQLTRSGWYEDDNRNLWGLFCQCFVSLLGYCLVLLGVLVLSQETSAWWVPLQRSSDGETHVTTFRFREIRGFNWEENMLKLIRLLSPCEKERMNYYVAHVLKIYV